MSLPNHVNMKNQEIPCYLIHYFNSYAIMEKMTYSFQQAFPE